MDADILLKIGWSLDDGHPLADAVAPAAPNAATAFVVAKLPGTGILEVWTTSLRPGRAAGRRSGGVLPPSALGWMS